MVKHKETYILLHARIRNDNETLLQLGTTIYIFYLYVYKALYLEFLWLFTKQISELHDWQNRQKNSHENYLFLDMTLKRKTFF